jgi:SAM-dependent methyltransferase
MKAVINQVKKFYEQSYSEMGFGAQRRYPNEELCRFMGRNLFSIPHSDRSHVKVLEVGCGSGSNLWMIAKEGFSTFGIDLSEESLALCGQMMHKYGVDAQLTAQDMCQTNFPASEFNFIVDVFSSYCLSKDLGVKFIAEIVRLLKPGGKFFSYFPSKRSDAFIRPGNSSLIDSDTLDSISRKDAAFSGQRYPFRFMYPQEYKDLLISQGLDVTYLETVGRTYHNGSEYFEFVVVEAQKP